MILLLSFRGEILVSILVVSLITGLVAGGALSADIKENPKKYKKYLDADEAKRKAKEEARKKAKEQSRH